LRRYQVNLPLAQTLKKFAAFTAAELAEDIHFLAPNSLKLKEFIQPTQIRHPGIVI
jgi:hypothetical protein